MLAPKLNMPTPGTSTIAGSAPRIARAVRGRRAGSSRPRTRRGTPRAAPSAARRRPRRARATGRSTTSGRTLVRRKWSGQDVPSAASRGCSVEARKSRTTSASVKCPTCGLSVDASPRITGASAAALMPALGRRAGPRSPGTGGAERLGPAALGEEALRRPDDLQAVGLALLAGLAPGGDAVAAEDAADRLRVLLRDRGDVEARAGSPAGATAPRRRGRRSTPGSAPRRRRRWPGRCRSRGAGGRRARAVTRPCMAVSIDGAAPPRPCRQ